MLQVQVQFAGWSCMMMRPGLSGLVAILGGQAGGEEGPRERDSHPAPPLRLQRDATEH